MFCVYLPLVYYSGCRKILKIENSEKKKQTKKKKKWSRYVVERELPTNMAWIHAAVSEKPEIMDDRRTTDNRRLYHDISSADKVQQS